MRSLIIAVALLCALAQQPPARAAAPDGRTLFAERCGMCHRTNGMGVGILARRSGDSSKGLLEERKDISALLVMTVTRSGIGNMPRIPRGEVSDPEMKLIADYLAKGNRP